MATRIDGGLLDLLCQQRDLDWERRRPCGARYTHPSTADAGGRACSSPRSRRRMFRPPRPVPSNFTTRRWRVFAEPVHQVPRRPLRDRSTQLVQVHPADARLVRRARGRPQWPKSGIRALLLWSTVPVLTLNRFRQRVTRQRYGFVLCFAPTRTHAARAAVRATQIPNPSQRDRSNDALGVDPSPSGNSPQNVDQADAVSVASAPVLAARHEYSIVPTRAFLSVNKQNGLTCR